jgi:hypothetical protein
MSSRIRMTIIQILGAGEFFKIKDYWFRDNQSHILAFLDLSFII